MSGEDQQPGAAVGGDGAASESIIALVTAPAAQSTHREALRAARSRADQGFPHRIFAVPVAPVEPCNTARENASFSERLLSGTIVLFGNARAETPRANAPREGGVIGVSGPAAKRYESTHRAVC
jgi:hypothetical protein